MSGCEARATDRFHDLIRLVLDFIAVRHHFFFLATRRRFGLCFSSEGIWRFMKESNRGTVNDVSPYRWLQIMPLSMSC